VTRHRLLVLLGAPRTWLVALGVLLVALGASGWWQAGHYRPELVRVAPIPGSPTLDEVFGGPPSRATFHGVGWVSDLHRGLALAFVVCSVMLLATVVVRGARDRRADLALLGTLAAGGATVWAALWSASRITWVVLGLWAVRVDVRYRGIWNIGFDSSVRFAGTRQPKEVSPLEYRHLAVGHLIAVPAILVMLIALALVRTSSQPRR
jgi:hypothetical protein